MMPRVLVLPGETTLPRLITGCLLPTLLPSLQVSRDAETDLSKLTHEKQGIKGNVRMRVLLQASRDKELIAGLGEKKCCGRLIGLLGIQEDTDWVENYIIRTVAGLLHLVGNLNLLYCPY